MLPKLKLCAVAPSGTELCWELADPNMEHIPDDFLRASTGLTGYGTLKLGPRGRQELKTIGTYAFFKTKLTGLDLTDVGGGLARVDR